MEESTPPFCCINLTEGSPNVELLTDVLPTIETGFHAFYAHDWLISGLKDSVEGSPQLLEKTFMASISTFEKLPINDDIHSQLANNSTSSPLVLISALDSTEKAELITFFFRGLRDKLNEQSNFLEHPGFSLNQAATWDLFLERERYSGLVPGAHDYYEYLLWNSGHCLGQANLNDIDVWYGAGWINAKLRKADLPIHSWQLGDLNTWCGKAKAYLEDSLAHLANFYQTNSDKKPFNMERYGNFVRSLCEFLPYHKSRYSKRFIPSNSLGEKGGPMRWRGLLDDRLYLRKRHLLMDGWLTLWPYQEAGETTLYLQPGSLALFYWAAKKAARPYTESPTEFLENYDWSDPHWFGGNWKRSRGEASE